MEVIVIKFVGVVCLDRGAISPGCAPDNDSCMGGERDMHYLGTGVGIY